MLQQATIHLLGPELNNPYAEEYARLHEESVEAGKIVIEKNENATIRVLSFDYDGCLARNGKKTHVVDDNKTFFDSILNALRLEDKKVILMMGSNRQKSDTDHMNSLFNKNGSCTTALLDVYNYLKKCLKDSNPSVAIGIDNYLLADSFNQKPAGTEFKKILRKVTNLNEEEKDINNKSLKIDESKFTLLYAQIHKVASDHPDNKIIFDFYDDRDKDILSGLHDIFAYNADLLPKNVTLRLHAYAGDKESQTNFLALKGTGRIDYNFQENIQCIPQSNLNDQSKTFTEDLKKNVLVFRSKRVVLNPLRVTAQIAGGIAACAAGIAFLAVSGLMLAHGNILGAALCTSMALKLISVGLGIGFGLTIAGAASAGVTFFSSAVRKIGPKATPAKTNMLAC
jgi:hypothetical protein